MSVVALACQQRTAKYPEGRTGRDSGYQAHRRAGERPCEACRVAHLTKCADRWSDLTDAERAERRDLNRAEAARYRHTNPAAARAAKHRHIASNRAIIRDAKTRPCTDCGAAHPYYVMQFDHVGDDKAFNIGIIGPTTGRRRLLAEIAKCEVVCANCHAERSFRRLNLRHRIP